MNAPKCKFTPRLHHICLFRRQNQNFPGGHSPRSGGMAIKKILISWKISTLFLGTVQHFKIISALEQHNQSLLQLAKIS